MQPDLTQRVHVRSDSLTFPRITFYIDFFFFLNKCDAHICPLPPALPTHSVTFRCLSATWLCISTLQNRHRQSEDEIRSRIIYLSSQTAKSKQGWEGYFKNIFQYSYYLLKNEVSNIMQVSQYQIKVTRLFHNTFEKYKETV